MMDFMGSIELRLIATTSFYKIEFFVDIIFQRMYRIHSKKKRKQTKKNIHISFHKRQQYIKKKSSNNDPFHSNVKYNVVPRYYENRMKVKRDVKEVVNFSI